MELAEDTYEEQGVENWLKCLLTHKDSWHLVSASVLSRGRRLLPLNKISPEVYL